VSLYLRADDERHLREAWGDGFDDEVLQLRERVQLEVREEDLALRRRQPRIGPRTYRALLEQVVDDKLSCELRGAALELRLKAIDAAIRRRRAVKAVAWDTVLSELGVVLVPLPKAWTERVMTWTREHVFAGILAGRGIETAPHVTVKYGLTTLDDAAVVAAVQRAGPLTLELGPLAVFTDDPEHDVLVITVSSAGLEALRRRIERQASWDDAHALEFRPHVTRAYLRKGAGALWPGHREFVGARVTVDVAVYQPKGDGTAVSIPLGDGLQGPEPSEAVVQSVLACAERVGADATIRYVIRDPVTGDIAATVERRSAGSVLRKAAER